MNSASLAGAYLNLEQIESVAYAFYLRSMGGSVTEANRFPASTASPSNRTGRRAVCG
ncbi:MULTISPECIES: hypothetical protein [Streptomyces]|uniref:hypothetical protein n=1 Tax=Streptomyces TaxID=1883 RepID=UPI000AB0B512|nr:hypothetical protein [Streptomyces durhamensis]